MEAKDKHKRSGDNGGEDPPVPISNTEVKLPSAEDTWREAAWENRKLPVSLKSRACKRSAFLAFCFYLHAETRTWCGKVEYVAARIHLKQLIL